MTESYLLGVILFAPFVGAAVLATPWVSNRHPLLVRQLAAFFAGISFFGSFILLFAFDWQKGGYQFQQKYVWSEQLGIQFYIGVDGIGVPMVLASSILLFAGVFISWHIKDRTKEFYAFLLILAGATIGVYVSLDLFFLYFFYEMSVIPMYPLLGVWGSHTKGYLETTNAEEWERPDAPRFILNFARNSKEYAAMKLTLFLSAGAVVALLGILLIYKFSGLNTFEIPVLAEKARFGGTLAVVIWLLCFFGFASIAPLWPLHSWSPVGHAAAPATGMLFAMAGWVYDQTHTRDIPSLGGLMTKMPFVAGCFLVACMASIGMPGTVNFVAEIMIVLGSWAKYPVQTIIAVLGIVLTMAYLFRMMRVVFYGPLSELGHHAHDTRGWVDRLPLAIMMGTSIVFGILPGQLLHVIRSGVVPILARIIQVAPIATQVGGSVLP